MVGTIDIAGKPVKKSTVAVAAIGVVVAGVGVYRYRKSQAANAAAQAAATAPGTGAGASDAIDPATGFAYGSAEDAAALTAQAGYNYGTGSGYYSGPGGGGSVNAGFTSNAQWAQAAEDYLVNTAEADANTVGNAIGKYITGGVVTADQQQVIEQAIAFEGWPPVAGTDGYPPSIRTAPAVPPVQGGGNPPTGHPIPAPSPTPTPPVPVPSAKISVPNVIHDNWGMAYNHIHDAGLVPKVKGSSTLKGINTHRTVTAQSPAGGTKVDKNAVVTITLSK